MIDDDGYLRRALSSIADDLAFRQSIEVSEKEIEKIINNHMTIFLHYMKVIRNGMDIRPVIVGMVIVMLACLLIL